MLSGKIKVSKQVASFLAGKGHEVEILVDWCLVEAVVLGQYYDFQMQASREAGLGLMVPFQYSSSAAAEAAEGTVWVKDLYKSHSSGKWVVGYRLYRKFRR